MKIRLHLLFVSAMLMISLSALGQNVRGFYLQEVGTWLGNITSENEILQYAQGNGFNYILFYDLGDISWTNTTQKNKLAAFISKARTQYGIVQVGGVVEYAGYVSQFILPYNNSRTNNLEKFDVINLEFEFWVSSSVSYYCSKFLSAAGFTCDAAGAWNFAWREFKLIDDMCLANGMMSEFYLGWPSLTQMQQIASRADRILLSAYRPTDSDIYLYSKQRMKDIATIGGTTKILTLMSSESSFMGSWLNTHPQTQPYQSMAAALNAETLSFKQNINLQGVQWFTYKYMPKTMLATATISSSGPLAFCPGGSVTLTANSGTAYLWSPGGQTTQSVNVTNAGSYTVRVTNSSGTAVTSSPAVVSTSGTGTASTISASGPTSFCPGGSVVLTSSSASSYLWSNGATTQAITVSSSGTFSVTAGSGSCSATSAPITVNSSAAPTIPAITSSGSLNVCPGTILTLTSSPANGYLWSNGATTRSIAISSAGNYSVAAFSGPSCSALSAINSVTLLTAPAKPVITAGSSTTLTTSNPTVVLTSSVGSTYNWSTTDVTKAITVTTQGTYLVTVTGSNGCSAISNPVAVIANGCTPPPLPTIAASGSTIITSGQSVVLTSSASGGYLWSTGAQTASITVTTPGIYTVRSYNKGGCYSTSLPTTVTVLAVRRANASYESNENSLNQLNLYPNPASDLLNIAFNQTENKLFTITLFDATGRIVKNIAYTSILGENKLEIDLAGLIRGMYYLQLSSDNQKHMKKVVVE